MESLPYSSPNWNQKTYQRLRTALSLGLRRQLFIAVCDDLGLQNRLASKLHAELATKPEAPEEPLRLVSLHLHLEDPNPLGQIAQWLNDYQPSPPIPAFQIVGVEHLTSQPANIQRLFLRRLQSIELPLGRERSPSPSRKYINESSLLLWLPRPWFNLIQKSVPEFWQWHTGLFEFVGEPSPLPPAAIDPENSLPKIWEDDLDLEEVTTLSRSGVKKQNPPPTPALTKAYLSLAQQYRERLEKGEITEENLIIAIQSYEQAVVGLGVTGLQEHPLQLVDVLNDLGNLYLMRSRLLRDPGQAKAQLEQGISLYYQALEKFTPTEAVDTYAMIQSNLGAAYGDLARYTTASNPEASPLQQSIHAYQEALRYRDKEREPLKYAATQNNLGTTYWHLAQQVGAKEIAANYLQAAIAAYAEAMTHYYSQGEALNWAMIQNNLGTAYWNLAQYEQPESWLQLAVGAYQDALKYRKRDTFPAACAATQNNLATAFWHLAERCADNPAARREYLQKAISIYDSALAIAEQLNQQSPPIPVSFDVLATRNNLGFAYYQIATEGLLELKPQSKSRYLELALKQHLLALQGFPPGSDAQRNAFDFVIKTVRAFYREGGVTGQSLALSLIPGQLLPDILPRL
jgi:tetratricopeptide (TPR) repeat protein